MARTWILATGILFIGLVAATEYTRPPPKRVLVTRCTKPSSHPQQVHISAVGSDYMRITWITEDNHALSQVDYGRAPGVYDMSGTGDHTTYRYFFYKSGTIHQVKIGPLDPDTVYYYRCGGADPMYTFKTPAASLPVEFAIAGDLGQTEWTASTLNHINSSNYDMLLLPGDLSYADTNQPLWDSFGRLVEPLASARPWMVTQGNHEIEAFPIFDWFHPFASYNHRWRMPYEESGSTSNLYYSFDVAGGAVHIVMLGSYTDFGTDSDQYKWLVKDLANVDRNRTPWIIVLLHAPWYNTNSAHQGEGENMRKAMEPLLYNARADIVFVGHVHAYERFTRVYDNSANSCGPMHITIGDGGNREGLALDFEEDHKSAPLSLFREASFGHGRLKVVNRTHAHWSWHRNDDSESTVRDEVWLESLSSGGGCGVGQTIEKLRANDEL